jgi:hypothetical protein
VNKPERKNPMATEVRRKKIENGVTEDIDVLSSGGKYAGSSLITPSLAINNVARQSTNLKEKVGFEQ